MSKHKWHKEIKAWADGAKIEGRYLKADGWSEWQEEKYGFIWYRDNAEYRIKPQPKEPQYLYVMESGSSYSFFNSPNHPHPKVKCIGKIPLIKLEQDDE